MCTAFRIKSTSFCPGYISDLSYGMMFLLDALQLNCFHRDVLQFISLNVTRTDIYVKMIDK